MYVQMGFRTIEEQVLLRLHRFAGHTCHRKNVQERFVSDAMDMAHEAGWRMLSVLGRAMQSHGK